MVKGRNVEKKMSILIFYDWAALVTSYFNVWRKEGLKIKLEHSKQTNCCQITELLMMTQTYLSLRGSALRNIWKSNIIFVQQSIISHIQPAHL